MGVGTVRSVSSLSILDSKSSEKQRDKCLCCEELRFELQNAKMEILSYEEILKVIQEELSNKELRNKSEPSKQNYCRGQSKVLTSKDDWVQVATKINRKYKDFNSNLVQLIPHTANKFELLYNLKVNESTSTPIMEQETLNISIYQKTMRKTQLVKSVRN